jgi:poly-gamma-glutamate synthesis protein (capsule biosynthesis protein)
VELALAGDTMLGRNVGDRLAEVGPHGLFADEVVAACREADLFVLNLECAISERGERWDDPRKPYFFRAPPVAVEVLRHLGVSCVTLANNHALDYGPQALLDTIDHLRAGGVAVVGAGVDVAAARAPALWSRAAGASRSSASPTIRPTTPRPPTARGWPMPTCARGFRHGWSTRWGRPAPTWWWPPPTGGRT